MSFKLDHAKPLVWTVDGVLSADECVAMIARIDTTGCVPAPITTGAGFVMRPDIRNNTRAQIHDEALAAMLFSRVRASVPEELGGCRAIGANELFRCYRYEIGQYFAPHYDGAFQRNGVEASRLTFIIYLNDGFEGGTTDFPGLSQRIAPKAGRALFFQHRILHEGCEVDAGVKYVLRSDIMYRLNGT